MLITKSSQLIIALTLLQELQERAKATGKNKRELYLNLEAPSEQVVQLGVFLLDVSQPQIEPPPLVAEFFLGFVPPTDGNRDTVSIQMLGRRGGQEHKAALSMHGNGAGFVSYAKELASKAMLFLTKGEWLAPTEGLHNYGAGGPTTLQ